MAHNKSSYEVALNLLCTEINLLYNKDRNKQHLVCLMQGIKLSALIQLGYYIFDVASAF